MTFSWCVDWQLYCSQCQPSLAWIEIKGERTPVTNLAVSAQKTSDSCASSDVEDNDSSVNMASGGSKRKRNKLENSEWISVKNYTLRLISEFLFSLNFVKCTFNLLNESAFRRVRWNWDFPRNYNRSSKPSKAIRTRIVCWIYASEMFLDLWIALIYFKFFNNLSLIRSTDSYWKFS